MEPTQELETECNIVLTKSQGEEKNMKNKMQKCNKSNNHEKCNQSKRRAHYELKYEAKALQFLKATIMTASYKIVPLP
uniref:Uncharacterized protein n=1 Tax=Cucumis melo TaxID=3656 RepID=A0A9I9E608_CUCME